MGTNGNFPFLSFLLTDLGVTVDERSASKIDHTAKDCCARVGQQVSFTHPILVARSCDHIGAHAHTFSEAMFLAGQWRSFHVSYYGHEYVL